MKLLRYIGDGFIPGVPACDHECEDDALAAKLVAGGAYEYAELTPEEKKAHELEGKAAKAQANAQAAKAAKAEAEAAEAAKAEAERVATERAERTAGRIAAAEAALAEAKDGTD